MSSSAEPRTAPRRRIAGERGRTRGASTPEAGASAPEAGTSTLEAATSTLEAPQPVEALRAPRAPRRSLRERLTPPARPQRGGYAADAADEAAGRRRWVAPVAALVVALAALGGMLGITAQDAAAQDGVDRAAASQARTSIEQMLSYDYKTIDAQSAQIEGLLTGSFKREFTTAMDKDIKPLAVKNQTVVQARVSDVGVMSSSPTTVKVLAFVNQARVGADQKQPVVDQNRVIATLTKVGNRWLISKVDAF